MRIEKLPKIGEESIGDYIHHSGFAVFEYRDDLQDLFNRLDRDLEKYGLHVAMIDIDDVYAWKIEPISLLDATKYYVEKGVPIG